MSSVWDKLWKKFEAADETVDVWKILGGSWLDDVKAEGDKLQEESEEMSKLINLHAEARDSYVTKLETENEAHKELNISQFQEIGRLMKIERRLNSIVKSVGDTENAVIVSGEKHGKFIEATQKLEAVKNAIKADLHWNDKLKCYTMSMPVGKYLERFDWDGSKASAPPCSRCGGKGEIITGRVFDTLPPQYETIPCPLCNPEKEVLDE